MPVLGDDADLAKLTVEGDELAISTIASRSRRAQREGSPQEVHDRQHYELVDWRRGNTELNYRRFFDITTLAAVTVERPEVFEDTHREILTWVNAEGVTGLRVDHPDGLADPGAYVRRLRDAAPNAWIVIEKILHPGEELPASWPVDGTTGYDALREMSGVLLDPAGEATFTKLAERLGVRTDFAAVEEEARRLVTDSILVAEVRRIAAAARRRRCRGGTCGCRRGDDRVRRLSVIPARGRVDLARRDRRGSLPASRSRRCVDGARRAGARRPRG